METEEGDIARETLLRAVRNLDEGNPNRAKTNVEAAATLIQIEIREANRKRKAKAFRGTPGETREDG